MAIPESIQNNPESLAAYQRAVQEADKVTANVQNGQQELPSADNRELYGSSTDEMEPHMVIGSAVQGLSAHRATIAPVHHLSDETRKIGLSHIEAIRQQQGW